MKEVLQKNLLCMAYLLLLAGTVMSQTPKHWTLPNHPGTWDALGMTATMVVNVDGVELSNSNIEMAAFIGENLMSEGELPIVQSSGRYLYFMTLNGFVTPSNANYHNRLTFKLYDHSTDTELEYMTPLEVMYSSNWVLGSTSNPFVVSFFTNTDELAWTKVTAADLKSGDVVVIGGSQSDYVISREKGNVGGTYDIERVGNTITFAEPSSAANWYRKAPQKFVVYKDAIANSNDAVALFALSGYLRTPEKDPEDELDYNEFDLWPSLNITSSVPELNAYWSVAIDGGHANLTAIGDNPYSTMQFKTDEGVFACFPSASEESLCIYRLGERGDDPGPEPITNHYVPVSNQYGSIMPVLGAVLIDGEEQSSTVLEIGAFCGEECRGSAFAAYFPPTSQYLYQLPVYGANGDTITFKLFDHDLQQELNLVSETSLLFTENGYGSLATPQTLSFHSRRMIAVAVEPSESGVVTGMGEYLPGETCVLEAVANEGYAFSHWKEGDAVVSSDAMYSFIVEDGRALTACFEYKQTTLLDDGWNWYSTYINQTGEDGLLHLEESLGSNGILILARSGLMVENYNGSYWWGGLTAIENEQMYAIRTNQSCEVVMQGNKADVQQHPVTIQPGWNWIGYPCDTEMSLEQALASIVPNENDMLKSHTTFSTYFPNWGWYGAVETMVPGQGYKYNSKSDTNQLLVYPNPSKSVKASAKNDGKTHFENHGLGCRDNMNVMATVLLDDMELSGDRYELAAFVNGVCHGSVKLMYVEPLQGDVAFLTVLGEANDAVTFRLYDEETGLTYEAEEGVAFEADAVLGNQHERYPVRFKSTALAATRPLLFPNPVGRGERIFVENVKEGVVMEIVNLLGVTVKTERLSNANAAVDCDLVPGVYTVKMVMGQQTLLVEKLLIK